MHRSHLFFLTAALCATASTGCLFVPRSQLAAAQAQAAQLAEQNRSQQSAIDNLANHSHEVEDRLMQTETQLAAVDQKSRADAKRLAALEGELFDGHGNRLPPGLSKQLADLARRHETLQFDPAIGAAKLDTDVLFDSGEAELKEDAQQMLAEFSKIMRSPEARDLKLMVVGHTDALKIAKRDVRERFSDNFHLASARALAVADFMKKAGIPEQRIGVSGFAGHEAVASNETAEDRRLNRRVEIFVLPPEATVVGWTETTTRLY